MKQARKRKWTPYPIQRHGGLKRILINFEAEVLTI